MSDILTLAQRELIGENYNRLAVIVAEARAQIRDHQPIFGRLSEQLGDADHQLENLRALVESIVDTGGIEDAVQGVSRPATVRDAEIVARIMSRTAQQYADLASFAVDFAPTNVVKTVLSRTAFDLAELAAHLGKGAQSIIESVGDLAGGVGKGVKAVAWVLPAVVFGAAMVAIGVAAMRAREQLRRTNPSKRKRRRKEAA